MTWLRWPRLGLRREMLILLPVTTLALVLVSTFTLFSYRSAVRLLIEERQLEAAELAADLADSLAGPGMPSAAELQRLTPGAAGTALADGDGEVLVALGALAGADLMAPLDGEPLADTAAVGPGGRLPDRIAGYARWRQGGRARIVRVDLPAAVLARQWQGLTVLSWVVLSANVGLTVLVLLFLRHLLTPYEALLEQARRLDRGEAEEDEASFLISTVERAMATLAEAPEPSPEEDMAALQRALGPSLESGLLVLDREGRVLTLNPVGAELLDLETSAGRPRLGTFLARHPELAALLESAVSGGGGVHRRELSIRTARGNRTLGLTLHALARDDGSVRGHLILFVDLTESRQRAEEERLAASLAQLGELAAGLAHELRNSLATLSGYLTLIDRRPDEESITDYLSEIRRESDHLERVLDDFLSFARPDSRRLETVDLLAVLRAAARDPALEGRAVEITAGEGAPRAIRGDAQLLERAIRNLLHNAGQAEEEAGRSGPLTARLGGDGENVELAIEDRGRGVPPELRDRLFEPFVTGRREGVGLGLSLAQRIVALHGGSIRLEPRAGGGTRALLALPADTSV